MQQVKTEPDLSQGFDQNETALMGSCDPFSLKKFQQVHQTGLSSQSCIRDNQLLQPQENVAPLGTNWGTAVVGCAIWPPKSPACSISLGM